MRTLFLSRLSYMLLMVSVPVLCTAQTMTIDNQKESAPIIGFGGGNPPQAEADMMVNTLGATVARFDLSNRVRPWSAANFKTGIAKGFKFWIGSVWQPPPEYVTANRHLNPAKYAEFATWFVGQIKSFNTGTGTELYAASIQNEPSFGATEFYDACAYTSTEYRDVVRVVGAKMRQEGLKTFLFGSEELASNIGAWKGFSTAVCNDTAAASVTGALAVHGYEANGITTGSPQAQLWASLARTASTCKKNLWMTETSGFRIADPWAEALNWAKWQYATLKYGKITLYSHDGISGPSGASFASFIENSQMRPMGYAASMFWKYIREGAVQIDCISSDTSVAAPLAFHDKTAHTLTLVILNTGSARTITLAGTALPSQYHKYLTASGKNRSDEGMISATGSIAVPASCIMTLVGDYIPPSVAVHSSGSSRIAVPTSNRNRTEAVFRIDGRTLSPKRYVTGMVPAGIYFERHSSGDASIIHCLKK